MAWWHLEPPNPHPWYESFALHTVVLLITLFRHQTYMYVKRNQQSKGSANLQCMRSTLIEGKNQ